MSTASATKALAHLESRTAGYVGTPGPSGEVQQRGVAIVANHRVELIRRDGAIHHYEVTAPSGHVTVVRSRDEVLQVIA